MGRIAADVVSAYLREQVDALVRGEPDVRANAPDAIHKARVAIRRLRSTLAAFSKLLEPEAAGELAALDDRLAGWGRVLGRPRDLEVQRARLGELLGELPAGTPGLPEARARVDAVLGEAHDQALADVVSGLDAPEHARLWAAIAQVAAEPPFGPRAERRARKALPRAVARTERRVRRRAERAAGLQGDAREEALHSVRKSARRARYAGEVLASAGKSPEARAGKATADRHEEVQDALGAYHDAVVLRELLADLRRQATKAHEDPAPYDALSEAEARRADQALEDYEGLLADAALGEPVTPTPS
jgi:CHAD domain-containing protein